MNKNADRWGGDYIDISDLAVRLLFLFLPGIIGATIIDLLTTHRKRQMFHFILHSYLIGVFAYGILMFIVFICNQLNDKLFWKVTFLSSLLNSKEQIKVSEVFLATLIGAILAVILVVIINKKHIFKVAHFLGISNKHGEDDVWDYLFSDESIEWATVRDPNTKIVFHGAISAFSQKDDKRELLLADVIVYKDENSGELKELYEKEFIYLNFDISSKLEIEFERGRINEE
ncbi:DUF6338 family protein [Bacillus subtilis]|uniref:DUF6338 family protein n=1 Tax=Bacillus subtilis TaxID=1423 RepID=UPI00103DDB92|nr:DUF6338 family protein [Bacillus subtilis]QBJ83151.1 hypothetical protein DL538_14350 [Bacillus subtilis subsp. subtilis]